MTATWKQGNCRRERNATLTWQRQHWHRKSDPDYSAHNHVVIWRRVVFAKSVYFLGHCLSDEPLTSKMCFDKLLTKRWRKRRNSGGWCSKRFHRSKSKSHSIRATGVRSKIHTCQPQTVPLIAFFYWMSLNKWLHNNWWRRLGKRLLFNDIQ